MILRVTFFIMLFFYLLFYQPFSTYMKNRPVALKLGYTPEAEVLKLISGDLRYLIAQASVVKVLFYYGSLLDSNPNRIKHTPEFFNMFKTLQTAVKLDPYNMDAYYFTQAAFTWELQRITEVNDMLDWGMEHRTWDYNLPFYAGFNAAYFRKDYKAAADYMKKAAAISGEPLYTNLAARYFYEAGENSFAIAFIESMEKNVKDARIKKAYELRKRSLLAVKEIQDGVTRFKALHARLPHEIQELVSSGVMAVLPDDPYGGTFYLDESGFVRTTSKFAFGSKKQ